MSLSIISWSACGVGTCEASVGWEVTVLAPTVF